MVLGSALLRAGHRRKTGTHETKGTSCLFLEKREFWEPRRGSLPELKLLGLCRMSCWPLLATAVAVAGALCHWCPVGSHGLEWEVALQGS